MLSEINTDKIREVMTGLEDLAVIRGDEDPYLNMRQGRFKGSVELGYATVCFGCWLDFLLNDNPYKDEACGVTLYHFFNGADLFADYIGVKAEDKNELHPRSASIVLADVLCHNPKLWGNSYGRDYIHTPRAYISRRIFQDEWRRIRLKTVTNHWRKFADRIDEHRRAELVKGSAKAFNSFLDAFYKRRSDG